MWIGNKSYDPLDLKDEFLADRWVWAPKISEPMLSLSFDYDILSLGLLTYQVKRMDLQLEDQPNGCLATLNSSCQNIVIGKMLLNETEYSSGSGEVSHDTDVVCVAVIEKMDLFSGFFDGNVVYHCCGKSEQASVWQASSIECELVAESSHWFKAFAGTLNILTVIMILYCPAFLLALPDVIFNLQEECDKETQRVERARERRQQAQDRRSNPGTSRHGSINLNLGTSDFTQSYPLVQREHGQDEIRYGSIRLDGNIGSTVEGNQQTDRPISHGNESVNQSVVYLDDASPVNCSTLFGRYTQKLTDLVPFNIKLAFISYCVIPVFVYIKLGLNYLVKREFVVDLTSKQQAFLVGPLFRFLLDMKSFTIKAAATFPLIIILFSSPQDFLLTEKNKDEDTSSVGKAMSKHLIQQQQYLSKFSCCLIKKHKEVIQKSIEFCTHKCVAHIFTTDEHDCGRLKRASIIVWVLICNAIIL